MGFWSGLAHGAVMSAATLAALSVALPQDRAGREGGARVSAAARGAAGAEGAPGATAGEAAAGKAAPEAAPPSAPPATPVTDAAPRSAHDG
ncbi:hypothetical protein IC63_16355, partial [Paracoccus sphaerophysae]